MPKLNTIVARLVYFIFDSQVHIFWSEEKVSAGQVDLHIGQPNKHFIVTWGPKVVILTLAKY
jgi:hypothetical protein